MVLVSVFVRNEEIHSLFQKLSEGLPSLGSKTKMLSLDQCDELMVIYDTILIEVDLLKGFHVIFKNKQIHGCLKPHQLFCLLMVLGQIPSTLDLLQEFL